MWDVKCACAGPLSSYSSKARRDICMRDFASWHTCRSSQNATVLHQLLLGILIAWFAFACPAQELSGADTANFAIAPSPANLTIYQGTSGSTTICATRGPGISGNVDFAVTSPLPDGVTALLTPNPGGSNLLTFITGKEAAPGTTIIAIEGRSGTATAATTLALTINAPSYVLSISPIPFTITDGSTFSSIVTVVPWGDFSETVNLSGYQLPSGVSASFSNASTSSTSQLEWTADDSAPTGSSAAIIAGATPSVISYSQFQQNVIAKPVPSFAVGVSPAYLTINQGESSTDNIAIFDLDGFSGNVNLSVTQLPAGITAAFSQGATSDKSVLTLSASGSAAVGPQVISVWGTALGQTSLSPLYLTVQPRLAFKLSISPSLIKLVQGSSSSATIVVSPQPGFGDAHLSIASVLPPDVTASLTPLPGTCNIMLTLTANNSVTPGGYFFNLSGTAGNQTLISTIPLEIDVGTAAATPLFNLAGGTYSSAQTVVVSDATPGAKVYFTTDGTTPTAASNAYAAPIAVSSTQTIQAIAIAVGYSRSSVATATYIIDSPTNPVPEIETMSPAFTAAAANAFTLRLTGSGFSQGSTVYWGSSALITQYLNATTLTAQVLTSNVAEGGTVAVTVQSPSPGGGGSNAMLFEVDTASSTDASPVFSSATASIYAGQTAVYAVTIPAAAASVSATCMNLPNRATCVYSGATSQLNITTAASSPRGTYQVTVVFQESLPAPSSERPALPLLAFPFAPKMKRSKSRRKSMTLAILVGLILTAVFIIGCGSASGPRAIPAPAATQPITSSGLVSLTIQ
jgi:hypothetical protein